MGSPRRGRIRQLTLAIALAGALLAGASRRGVDRARRGRRRERDTAIPGRRRCVDVRDMAALGLRQTSCRPLQGERADHHPGQGVLDRTIPAALHAGVRVVLAVYPYPTASSRRASRRRRSSAPTSAPSRRSIRR